jgi:hypothetical protein
MKDILLSYAAYNIWANGKIIDVLKKLPEPQRIRKQAVALAVCAKPLITCGMWKASGTSGYILQSRL